MPRRTRRSRISSGAFDVPFLDAVEAFLEDGGAYRSAGRRLAARSDLEDVARLLPCVSGRPLEELSLAEVTTPDLRAAFAAFSTGRGRHEVHRAHLTWRALSTYLVTEDLLDRPLTEGIERPAHSTEPERAAGPDVAARLLEAAWRGSFSQGSWAERDVAFVATLAVTGLRMSEILALRTGSLVGPPHRRTIVVPGPAPRAVPVWPAYDVVLSRYLAMWPKRRPPGTGTGSAAPLFFGPEGARLTRREALGILARLAGGAGLPARLAPWTLGTSLRSTFAATSVGRPASAFEAAQVLRHAGVSIGVDDPPVAVGVPLPGE